MRQVEVLPSVQSEYSGSVPTIRVLRKSGTLDPYHAEPLASRCLHHDPALQVLEYPQSGERIRGRRNIQITRAKQPNKKRFTVRRVIGSGELWITEYVLTYDGRPSCTVSIMEFRDDKVARETQYFADPFEASTWRAQWVERMDR